MTPDSAQKKKRISWKKVLFFLWTLGLVGVMAFYLQPVFAQTVAIGTYSPAKHSRTYLALPLSGKNFSTSSLTAHAAGRMYLRGDAAATVLAAYVDLAITQPQWKFVYGEMGRKGGGDFWPHRTHKDGLSADFMSPTYVLDENGQKISTPFSCNVTNLWGYGVRIDAKGRSGDYHFDTAATIGHIAALHKAAAHNGLKIRRVILDPPLLALLRTDSEFAKIRHISFMAQRAWFPHDGHYHVDFVKK